MNIFDVHVQIPEALRYACNANLWLKQILEIRAHRYEPYHGV